MVIDPQEWAQMEFSECQLGDQRRTRRLIKVAAQVLARPDGSTPEQTESWGECKAVYRLMDCEDVSFEAVTDPHYRRTRATGQPGDVFLILNDTTEINYGGKRRATGLGLVGKNTGRGFFLHSALMRDPNSGSVIGLAGQDIYYRRPGQRKKAKGSRRKDAQRESAVWGRLIDKVGRPPEGIKWLHVCDRAADDYEVFCHALNQGCGWVIRACRLNRLIQTTDGKQLSLQEHLDNQPVKAVLEIEVPGSAKTPARTARAELRFAEVALPRPQVTNEWIRQNAPVEPLPMRVIELIELDPPADGEPLHWVLYTSEPIETVEQAQQCLGYYAQRWAVEEYHKALKTGCRVESRYYETADRLERITGLLGIVAVQLLRMRSIARETPERPAADVVPTEWVEVLTQERRVKTKGGVAMTIQQFLRHLAGLGGHLGRKCDGQPGWITLWRGLEKLLLILRGDRCRQLRCG